jgi:CheY-like chemotaxis protein
MSTPPHVLSVGTDPLLLSSRTLILRAAGYQVEEAYTVKEAIRLVETDSIDVMLICHTIAKEDQQFLISTTRRKRRLMPILCLRSITYQSVPLNLQSRGLRSRRPAQCFAPGDSVYSARCEGEVSPITPPGQNQLIQLQALRRG